MRILNLYSGIGGNRRLWKDCDVTAVEIDERVAEIYQENFPDDPVIIMDAHRFLIEADLSRYDLIWSSPPCQTHSKMVRASRHDVQGYPDMRLYQEIIFLRNFFKGKWVVENVVPYYDPLIRPDARIGRHLFWANFFIMPFNVPEIPGNMSDHSSVEQAEKLKEWIGVKFEGNVYVRGNNDPCQVLRNCVHPSLGNHIKEMSVQEWQKKLF